MLRKSVAYFSIFIMLIVSIPSTVFADDLLSGPILGLSVENTEYNPRDETVTFDIEVKNKSDSRFIDNLNYRIEFYTGKSLNDNGLLFSTVDFVLSTKGELERLNPGQTRKETIQYVHPKTIPGGNYFFRIFAFNDDNSHYGATFTKDPLRLNGRGGFIGIIDAALIDVEKGTPHDLMEGPMLSEGARPLVSILRDRNLELFERIDEGEELFASYSITHINDLDTVVSKKDPVPLSELFRPDGGKALEIYFDPWEGQLAGAHTAIVSITNKDGDKVSEDMSVRLLYEGLIGRIFLADTSINSYRKGEPLDLKVNVLATGDVEAEYVDLDVVFHDTKNKQQSVSKRIDLPGTFEGVDTIVIFNEDKAKRSMVIDQVDLFLKDENGKILDTNTITLDVSEVFAYPRDSNTLQTVIILLIILIVIAVVVGLTHKKTRGSSIAIMIALAFITSAFIHNNPSLVFADAGLGPTDLPTIYTTDGGADVKDLDKDGDTTERLPKPQLTGDLLGIWEEPTHVPSGDQGFCETDACQDINFWVKVQCKSCGNEGLEIEVNYFNNWKGQELPIAVRDQQFILNTADLDSAFEYGYYAVQGEDTEPKTIVQKNSDQLEKAPEGHLAGVPVNADDLINFWIYGPFNVEYCFDDDGVNDMCEIIPEAEPDGVYHQPYNIQAKTKFGSSYCQLSYGVDNQEDLDDIENVEGLIAGIEAELEALFNMVTLNNVHDVYCDAPGCVRGSFYLDENEDGQRDVDENYIRPNGTPSSWGGIVADLYGLVQGTDIYSNNVGLSGLLSETYDVDNSRPYFNATMTPGVYLVSLDEENSPVGWGDVLEDSISVNLNSAEIKHVEIPIALGGEGEEGYKTVFSCSVDI
ncbi:hypothetical protein N9L18_00395 [Candidatus Pacebacteria bacterium]|nr:hypothetical protein [Candidatus Paceibacterota bacterium]